MFSLYGVINIVLVNISNRSEQWNLFLPGLLKTINR